MAKTTATARVIDFVKRVTDPVVQPFRAAEAVTEAAVETAGQHQLDGATFGIPRPPTFVKDYPGAVAYFLDEDERDILYAMPWPYRGCPHDEQTNSTTWLIDGKSYESARRDAQGNWFFRRVR